MKLMLAQNTAQQRAAARRLAVYQARRAEWQAGQPLR